MAVTACLANCTQVDPCAVPCHSHSWKGVLCQGLVVLHATSPPLIGTLFMACNVQPRSEIWRAFRIARHDNTP